MLIDRIEWVVIPSRDGSGGSSERRIDWWESRSPIWSSLKKNRNINVDIADPLGNIGSVPD